MKLVIAGSRSFYDMTGGDRIPWRFDDGLEQALKEQKWGDGNALDNVSEVLCGGAIGPDQWGAEWASRKGIPVTFYPALWSRYGKKAGVMRNEDMANDADFIVVFWDQESRGTKHMIELAERLSKPCRDLGWVYMAGS